MEDIIVKLTLIGVLGIGAQWLAWRFNLPAIVLMAVAGILAGPVTGVLQPEADFGELFRPMIAVAVAVILFEGGLTLNFHELRDASRGVRRLVFPGVFVGWVLGTLAAHYVAGLSLPVAILFAGILVVTGPTVIIPLLRQAKLAARPRAILKWEGIINDPIGALFAVLVFEYLHYADQGSTVAGTVFWVVIASTLAAGIGVGMGLGLAQLFRRGLIPEFLKAPFILCAVLICYAIADQIEHETGLVAVTALGITLGNARLASITEMRRFKEYVTVLFVSGVFVILTATLTPDVLYAVDWPLIGFVLSILFLVRPATVWISTIGAGLPWQERLLLGWIAPRGVVAVAVSGFFGAELVHLGYPEGADLIPLSFAIVFATVLAHGFSIKWLAERLDLTSKEDPGVLIVGASAWSTSFAQCLKNMDIPVAIADTGWRRLKSARLADIRTYHEEILSEATEHEIDMNKYGHMVAVTGNEAYNSLVCTEFGPEIGRNNVLQLGGAEDDDPRGVSFTLRGRPLFKKGIGLEELLRRHYAGWIFQKTTLTDQYTYDNWLSDKPEEIEIILVQKKNGTLVFSANKARAEAGDTIVAYAPPPEKDTAKTTNSADS